MILEKLVALSVVICIIAFIMYRGSLNAINQRTYKYLFRPRNIGTNPPGPFLCNSIDDLRKHPMFKHWEDYYHLVQCNTNTTVKMIKQGHTWNEGIVVGWLEDNIAG